MRSLVDQTVARFGRLDVAVNNAGTEGKPGPVTEQTAETYAAMFDTNVLGTLLSMKHELRVMQAQGSGSIVNISSTMGERGAANLALYTASKHAVEGLTKSAALEAAAFGVRVNAVAPGPTETAMLDRLTGSAERKAAFFAAVPAEARRHAGGDRRGDPVRRLRQGRLHHRPDHPRQRRQDRELTSPNQPGFIGNASCPTFRERPLSSPAPRAASAAPAPWRSPRRALRSLVHYGRGRAEAEAVVARNPRCRRPRMPCRATWRRPMARISSPPRSVASSAIGSTSSSPMPASPVLATIEDTKVEDFDALFAVNVRAPFFLVQQLLPILGKRQQRRPVVLLAAHASVGTLAAYAATKGAIDTLVKHFAAALGERGIRVNAVAPGVVDTDMSSFAGTDAGRDFTLGMQALKRVAEPDDIADVIAFLASDAARWITGDTVRIDGGSKL